MPSFAFQWKSILNEENTFYFLSDIFTNKLYQDPELVALKERSLYYDGYASQESFVYPPLSTETESSSPISSQVGKSTKVRRQAYGISLGHEYISKKKYHLKLELNYAQNVGDIFSLSISEV